MRHRSPVSFNHEVAPELEALALWLQKEEYPLQRSVALFARAVPVRKGAHLSVELICFAPPSAPLFVFVVELGEVYLKMGDSKGLIIAISRARASLLTRPRYRYWTHLENELHWIPVRLRQRRFPVLNRFHLRYKKES